MDLLALGTLGHVFGVGLVLGLKVRNLVPYTHRMVFNYCLLSLRPVYVAACCSHSCSDTGMFAVHWSHPLRTPRVTLQMLLCA